MNHIGYLLADNSRLARWSFDRKVSAVGVTGPQARLVLLINREPGETQTYYAERLEVEPITLCRMVDRLEEAGLVARRVCDNDRRARRIELTPAGRGTLTELRTRVDAVLENMLDGLSPDERDDLTRLLERVSENLSAERESARANDE
ncbi:MarR family winged helix-turn-helix transcriptional regulator [Pseudoblastomonas halimionae]|uniref:MarR family transcriptional regulator n=1 Tax=Alteriqipengyuania halimionae TaxID=1926630 RepID=A0A6I4U5L2_9SPHN|nr:MarR family transcriptional regulator [Alteriqipengyuania halimionae]MXP09742.1 MarR family transcriptional regulator [Alteriqipengyuania halimionae]